jgi:hypothetical protein
MNKVIYFFLKTWLLLIAICSFSCSGDKEISGPIAQIEAEILNLPNWEIQYCWNGFYAQMKDNEEIFDFKISNNIKIVTAIGGKGMTASAGFSKESIDNFFI